MVKRSELLPNEDGNTKAQYARWAVAIQKILTSLRYKGIIGSDKECVWLVNGGDYHA